MGLKNDSDKLAKRLTINLPESLSEKLELEAQEEGVSLGEAARNAIKRDAYLREKEAEGWDVLLEDPNGKQYRIISR